MNLAEISMSGLKVSTPAPNFRRDLHAFVGYVRERTIKRAVRSNQIPKADVKRIAKLMSGPDALEQVNKYGESSWIDAIDWLALSMGFVSYDLDGEYAGYSSQSPSFYDNYMVFEDDVYANFLALSQAEQERRLWQVMYVVQEYSEMHGGHWLSTLDMFSPYGRATGAWNYVNLPNARQYLFDQLSRLDGGIWYSVADLVAHIKQDAPSFLLPTEFPKKDRFNRPLKIARYGNFYEVSEKNAAFYYHSMSDKPIPDDAPDGFERVEGRFVERFLEGIPLTLGYLDVAYQQAAYSGKYPTSGTLRAFRLNPNFVRWVRGESLAPRVVIQPNMEILLEETFYSPSVTGRLQDFAELVSEDTVTILRLDKQRVKATVAAEDGLDPVAELERLSARPLPANVVRELTEWAGQADSFTLYRELSLLEGDARLPESAEFTVQKINKNLRLVKNPIALHIALEENERVPLSITHADKSFALLPTGARSKFPTQAKPKKVAPARKKKPRVTLQRETQMTLHVPTADFYTALCSALVEQRCIFVTDADNHTITYANSQQAQIDAAIKALKSDYVIKIEDQ